MYIANKPINDKFGNRINEGDAFDKHRLNERYLIKLIQKGVIAYIQELEPIVSDEDIKLCVVTGMWKRPEVFKIFGKHYKKLGIDVIVVGSEGEASKNLAESFGFIYIEHPNQPLGSKMNATIREALKRDYTHVICVGSDDLLSKELIDEYVKLIRKGYHFIGVTDFYFYDLESGKASYWGGYREIYRKNHTVGAGRVLSRKMIESWGGVVWGCSDNRYLDTSMQKKLFRSEFPKFTFSLKEKGLLAVDIKSDVNMTPFRLWNNSHYIDSEIIKTKFDV
jgi:hypothetical protein